MDIKQFVNSTKQAVEGMFNENGEVKPMIVMHSANNVMLIPPDLSCQLFQMKNVSEKIFQLMIGKIAKDLNAEAIVIMTEAWIVKREAKDCLDKRIIPSEEADRQEIVVITIETKEDQALVTGYIDRSKEKPFISSFEDVYAKDMKQISGSLTNFFKVDLSELDDIPIIAETTKKPTEQDVRNIFNLSGKIDD